MIPYHKLQTSLIAIKSTKSTAAGRRRLVALLEQTFDALKQAITNLQKPALARRHASDLHATLIPAYLVDAAPLFGSQRTFVNQDQADTLVMSPGLFLDCAVRLFEEKDYQHIQAVIAHVHDCLRLLISVVEVPDQELSAEQRTKLRQCARSAPVWKKKIAGLGKK